MVTVHVPDPDDPHEFDSQIAELQRRIARRVEPLLVDVERTLAIRFEPQFEEFRRALSMRFEPQFAQFQRVLASQIEPLVAMQQAALLLKSEPLVAMQQKAMAARLGPLVEAFRVAGPTSVADVAEEQASGETSEVTDRVVDELHPLMPGMSRIQLRRWVLAYTAALVFV